MYNTFVADTCCEWLIPPGPWAPGWKKLVKLRADFPLPDKHNGLLRGDSADADSSPPVEPYRPQRLCPSRTQSYDIQAVFRA